MVELTYESALVCFAARLAEAVMRGEPDDVRVREAAATHTLSPAEVEALWRRELSLLLQERGNPTSPAEIAQARLDLTRIAMRCVLHEERRLRVTLWPAIQ